MLITKFYKKRWTEQKFDTFGFPFQIFFIVMCPSGSPEIMSQLSDSLLIINTVQVVSACAREPQHVKQRIAASVMIFGPTLTI
jgi:hypothetical protein